MSIAITAAAPSPPVHSPRTQALLHGPIVPTLLRLAWPNVLVMLAQASTGLIETWFVSRLGTDALAGMALVFPGFMMMQMLSAGAMGGGISSAIARALGARRRDDAALAICASVVLLVPLSPCLIFGLGPFPALGIAGGGVAVVFTTALTTLMLGWYILSGRCLVRLRLVRPRWPLFRDIFRVGAVAAVTTLQTTLTVALTTALVGAAAGPDAIAGYGTGGRLEYLLVPLVFGLGAPLVALVGTNIGAGQRTRALRIALIGGGAAFVLTEALGVAAAIWPTAWLGLFGHDPHMLATGTAYLRVVGPAYGFFGLGLSLYFASQGAGRLFWPLFAGLLRLIIAIGGGWIVLRATGSLEWMFAALSAALVAYGVMLSAAVASGAWFRLGWR